MADKDPVLETARELGLEVPVVQALHRRILRALDGDGILDMDEWHGHGDHCGTTHCRAGWVTHLAGAAGRHLERALIDLAYEREHQYEQLDHKRCSSPIALAAELIVRASCQPSARERLDFYCLEEDALADIQRCAGLEPPIDDTVSP